MKEKINKLLKYIKKQLKQINKTINYVHSKNNRFRICIFFDILWCYIYYSISYNEYRIFEFYNLKYENRKTFLSKIGYDVLKKRTNNHKYMSTINNQKKFINEYKELLKRNILDYKDLSFKEFEVFILNNPEILCLSYDKSKFERLNVNNFRSSAYMLEYMKNNKLNIFESSQSEINAISKLNPFSINYISIVTLLTKDDVDVVFASLTLGINKEYIKNALDENTISGKIDLKTSSLVDIFRDKAGNLYKEHPVSKIKFAGYKIPKFEESIKIAKRFAKVNTNIRQLEWRIVITKNGPIVICAFPWDDFYIAQLPENTVKRKGLIPYYNRNL